MDIYIIKRRFKKNYWQPIHFFRYSCIKTCPCFLNENLLQALASKLPLTLSLKVLASKIWNASRPAIAKQAYDPSQITLFHCASSSPSKDCKLQCSGRTLRFLPALWLMKLHSKIYLDCCLQPRVYGYVTLQCILEVHLLLPFALSDLSLPYLCSSSTRELGKIKLSHPWAVFRIHILQSLRPASETTMGLVILSLHLVLIGLMSTSWQHLRSCT